VLQGSTDGQRWIDIPFRYKVGNLTQSPPFIAPHQPRLDWQMWFAALSKYEETPWALRLVYKLLRGAPSTYALIGQGPFSPTEPPFLVRGILFEYMMTRNTTDAAWWTRQRKSEWLPPVELSNPSLGRLLIGMGADPSVTEECEPQGLTAKLREHVSVASVYGAAAAAVVVGWLVQLVF
jgi:hypothetical protein